MVLCLAYFWHCLYGDDFFYETYLYHLVRRDTRHNFSVYFYYLYLQGQQGAAVGLAAKAQALCVMLPQLIVVAGIAVRFQKDLNFAIFSQTLAFVAFNKVVTAQYFIWYIALLPLALPRTRLQLKWQGIKLIAAFLVAEIAWGLAAYQIEFGGRAAFLWVWIAGIGFFCVQVWILITMIQNHQEPGHAPPKQPKNKRS